MANALLTPTVITREFLRLLKNNLVIANTVSRAHEDDFKKIGETLQVRKPVRFTAQSGAAAVIQDVEEAWQTVTVDAQNHVAWKFDSRSLTLTIEEYSARYIAPAAAALAHKEETKIHGLYYKAYHSTGTPGTTPSSFLDVGGMKTLLSDHGAPYQDRKTMLNPDACLQIANQIGGFKNGYGVDSKAKKAQEMASLGMFAGFDNYESQSVAVHTTGILDGTPLVDGASQNVTYAASKNTWTQSLVIDGAGTNSAGWAKAGDVFTITGVNSINPANKESTGKLQNFTVTADATTAGGSTTLTISPPIITDGPYKTVDAGPADDAPLTFMGTAQTAYPQNLGYHRDAITYGTIPLEMPDSANWGSTISDDGLSMRVYKWLDGDNDEEKIRVDIMSFADVVHHDLITRLWG